MEQGFFELKVLKLQRETKEATTIFFEIPNELKDKFEYKAGQYLTMMTTINGEEIRRAYSLCTAPGIDPIPAVTVKAVTDGRMSGFVNKKLKVGDTLLVMPPNGKFIVEPDANASKTYILFGGGSGITPMLGIIKTVLLKEPQSKIFLVYANRDTDSVIFKNTLDQLEKEYKDRFKIYYSYDKAPMMWFGLKGFLTEKSVDEILRMRIGGNYLAAQYYICGPSPMMNIVKTGLSKSGIPTEQIHNEYFAAPVTPNSEPETKKEAGDFNGKPQITITVYGKTSTVEGDIHQTILDTANAAKLQPPYSCTVGVCTTCRAKVLKGKVEMMEREGLSDAEIDEGYVLTCQSLPRSPEIELIYE